MLDRLRDSCSEVRVVDRNGDGAKLELPGLARRRVEHGRLQVRARVAAEIARFQRARHERRRELAADHVELGGVDARATVCAKRPDEDKTEALDQLAPALVGLLALVQGAGQLDRRGEEVARPFPVGLPALSPLGQRLLLRL